MECCDICGDIGVADALITCSICKRNTEHMYCMKFFLEEHVNDWHCEECMSVHNPSVVNKSGELPAESRKLPNESRVGVGDWEKIVATGKTKYLTVEEAIKLPLGQKLPYNAFHKRTPRRNSVKYKFDSAIKPRFIDFSSLQNITPGPFRSLKPQRPANVEIHRKPNITGFRSPSSLRPSEALKDTNLVKEQPSNVQLPVTTRAVKQSSLPSEKTSPGAISGGDGHDNAIDQRSTSGAENTSEIYLLDSEKDLRVPALEASWKGSFKILDDNAQKEINHLVRAYPPLQVYKKIFDISKKMPQVLHFELVPSKPILNNLFNDYIPDRSDIGLYFFPGAGESSEEGNIFLTNQIISTNYALRKQIADVELLVFSSKLLHANCQSWQGKHFLWGVFRSLKPNATTCSEDRVLEPTVQPSDGVNHDQGQVHGNGEVDIEIDMTDGVNHDQGHVHDGGEVDMEIDMIGGISLGKIDVPVNKKPTASLAWPESVVPGLTVAPVAKIPSPIVKVESHDLIPPGFEEVYRMRIQSSSPPVAGIWNQDINKG